MGTIKPRWESLPERSIFSTYFKIWHLGISSILRNFKKWQKQEGFFDLPLLPFYCETDHKFQRQGI